MKFGDLESDGFEFNLIDFGNVFRVNPIDFFFRQCFRVEMQNQNALYLTKKREIDKLSEGIENPGQILERVKTKNSAKFAFKMIEDIRSTPIPDNLLKLLECKSKSEQLAVLKQIKIAKNEFQAFCFTAFEKYDFVYSFYQFQHLRNDVDEKLLPKFAYLEEDGSITKLGDTSLSDGKIKQILENRRLTFAKILEKDKDWHCFFYTFASLHGSEKGNLQHMHYVSNKWNFTIEQLIQKLKEKKYSFGSTPHIEYID